MTDPNHSAGVLFLIVDVPLCPESLELFHLLSLGNAEGITIEPEARPVDSLEGGVPHLALRGNTDPLESPPDAQALQLAAEIASRPSCEFSREAIARALALSSLARRVGADAVVSPTHRAFDARDRGLFEPVRLISPSQALALVGAHVRQRMRVSLGGTPLLVQERTEVYPLTGRISIPRGQDWWSSCVHTFGSRTELLRCAQAVFSRVGQAIRGRDAVHEALRTGSGRPAILDALYHLDVVLTSGVGALDALARVAHGMFGMKSPVQYVGWHKKKWSGELARRAPTVAGVIADKTRQRVLLEILVKVRNSIHGVPLEEFLSVEREDVSHCVEHRAMLSKELTGELKSVATANAGVICLSDIGVHLDQSAIAVLNIGRFAERGLAAIIDTIDELCAAMLTYPEFGPAPPLDLSDIEQAERLFCGSLAQIGNYPYRTDSPGLPAKPSLQRQILGTLRRQLPG